MTKRKKDPAKELEVKIKRVGGKVTKAKNSEIVLKTPFTKKMKVNLSRTPLGLRQCKVSPEESIFMTKCLTKCTSTPMYTENKLSRAGRMLKPNLKYKDMKAPRRPLSPILVEIGNLTTRMGKNLSKNGNLIELVDENQNMENVSYRNKSGRKLQKSNISPTDIKRKIVEPKSSPINIPSPKRSKVVEAQEQKVTTRLSKRSVGVPRVAVDSDDTEACIKPNQYKDKKLRVRLSHCSLDSINPREVDKSTDDKSLKSVNRRTRRNSSLAHSEPSNNSADQSLVRRLRADWTSTTFEEPTQIRRIHKQRLSPLIEIISEKSHDSFAQSSLKGLTTKKITDDEAYSSSAEFESDDEKENSRSKRAPTWKDLSNKKADSVSLTLNSSSPKVRLLRSRSHLQTTESENVLISKSTPESASVPSNIKGSNQTGKDSQRRSIGELDKGGEVLKDGQSKKDVPSRKSPLLDQSSEKVPSLESSERRSNSKKSSDDLTVTETAVSPQSRSQNLVNKSNLIEQILSSSADGDEHNTKASNDVTNFNSNATCTKKFFHSRIDSTIAVPKPVEPAKGRRRSGRKKKKDSIYEFLSQSSSDSNDPAADVIKKMIDTGKVTVAKHKKGTGKSVLPRIKRKAAMKKNTTKAEDVFVKPKPVVKRKPLQEKKEDTVHIDDDLHFEDDGAEILEEQPKRDPRGFSNLARSAMIKQAGKIDNTSQRKMITDRKELLAMAQKFVGQSTPVRVPSAPENTSQLSPIPGSTSPWRVDDDKFPSLFHFGRNSDNLPSFSSDHIPSTPVKNKSNSTSSFSSNDSNMENIAPPSSTATENGAQTSSNTRRALSYRSPLKAINILEVINIPPLALKDTGMETPDNSRKDNSNNTVTAALKDTGKETADKTRKDNSDKTVAAEVENVNNTSLFGFEDMIDEEDDEFRDVTVDPSVIPSKQNLKKKLQQLKNLRPETPVVASTSKNYRIKRVFDDERPKQRTLKQMLCSTMIDRQSAAAYDDTQQENNFNDGSDADLSNLFKDPVPDTTFDKSNPRRTYSRPFTRKRKLRHNFVMFMDSDASDDDDEVADKNYERKKKKRQRKEPNEDVELNKFVDEFNEMCKEVSEYELVVE